MVTPVEGREETVMGSEELCNLDLFTHQFGQEVRDGIDMTDEEVRASRLRINMSMARLGYSAKDRAQILYVLGLATPDEFRPEYRPDYPFRWCAKKLHNIGDPATYRIRKLQSLFADDRVCLACEEDKINIKGTAK